MNDPKPAMPVNNPTPADIARYNAWAARNGEPAWGAVHAAIAAPAPANVSALAVKTAVQNGVRARWNDATRRWEIVVNGRVVFLTEPNGQKTLAGGIYCRTARRLGHPEFELIAWRPGMHLGTGVSDVAYTVDGQPRTVRRFNPQTGFYEATRWGVDYFRDHAAEFTVNLPVYRVIRKVRADNTVVYLRALHGDNCWLPITDQEMADYMRDHGHFEHHHALRPAEAAGGISAAGGDWHARTPASLDSRDLDALHRQYADYQRAQDHRALHAERRLLRLRQHQGDIV